MEDKERSGRDGGEKGDRPLSRKLVWTRRERKLVWTRREDFADVNVPPGQHVYRLLSSLANGVTGAVECTVVIEATSGLHCTVQGTVVHQQPRESPGEGVETLAVRDRRP